MNKGSRLCTSSEELSMNSDTAPSAQTLDGNPWRAFDPVKGDECVALVDSLVILLSSGWKSRRRILRIA